MFFSVIIPLFNKENYISRAVFSVLEQTFRDFEVIIINDGSTDRSADVMCQFDDPRIRLINQHNGGVSHARNVGIMHAKADWLAFLDADDEWLPDFLQIMHDTIREQGTTLVFGSNYYLESRGRRYVEDPESGLINYFSAYRNSTAHLCSSALVVHRQAFEVAGIYPEDIRVGEDMDLHARLAWSHRVFFVPKPLAIYHIGVSGNTVQSAYPLGKKYPAVVHSFYKWFEADKIPSHMIDDSKFYAAKLVAVHADRLLYINGMRWRTLAFLWHHRCFAKYCITEIEELIRVILPSQSRIFPFNVILKVAIAHLRSLK